MKILKKELNALLLSFRRRVLRSVAVGLLERGVSAKIARQVTGCSNSWIYEQRNRIRRSVDAEEEI